jgi:hypothetical protein
MANKKILLGLTTTPNSDWREKIREIDKYNIKELALFPTFFKPDERKELYGLLEKTGLKIIPHVHIRGEDMPPEELDWLIKRYKTKIFNSHSVQDYPMNFDYSKYKLYLENTYTIPTEAELKKYNGFCVDFSHWEDGRKKKSQVYENFAELLSRYTIGCCHISAITEGLICDLDGDSTYSSHIFSDLSELAYMKKYLKYLPKIVSLELTNSFADQLKAKKYLEKIIN